MGGSRPFWVELFSVHPSMKSHILFYVIGLTNWHGFLDIIHIKVNKGRKSAILNLVKLILLRAYPSWNRILFYSNGLAIWHGLSYIRYIQVNNDHRSAIWI